MDNRNRMLADLARRTVSWLNIGPQKKKDFRQSCTILNGFKKQVNKNFDNDFRDKIPGFYDKYSFGATLSVFRDELSTALAALYGNDNDLSCEMKKQKQD